MLLGCVAESSEASSGTTQFTSTFNRLSRRLRASFTALHNEAVEKHQSLDSQINTNNTDDEFDDDAYREDDDAGILNVDQEEGYESCSYHYMTAYLNRADVKAALHIPDTIIVSDWAHMSHCIGTQTMYIC